MLHHFVLEDILLVKATVKIIVERKEVVHVIVTDLLGLGVVDLENKN